MGRHFGFKLLLLVLIVLLSNVADVTAVLCYSYYSTYGFKYCYYSCCGSSYSRCCCYLYYNYCYDAAVYAYTAVSIGVIVGAVIGGLIGLALLISLIVCLCCMLNKKKSTGRVVQPVVATGATPGVAVVSNLQYSQTQYGYPAHQPMPMNTYQPAQPLPGQAMYPPPPNPAYPPVQPPAYSQITQGQPPAQVTQGQPPETSPFNEVASAPPQATAYGNQNSNANT